MYKVFPRKLIFISISWLVIGLYLVFDSLNGFFSSFSFRITSIPTIVWLVANCILLNLVWRFIWKRIPYLSKHIFPDLNGKWQVELLSNWPRQEQLLEAGNSKKIKLDMRTCAEDKLAPLKPIILEAEIYQSWWKIEMKLYNPEGNTPIDKSNTISVIPFGRDGLVSAGINYIYKQANSTDNVSDDIEFYGAARLEYDAEKDQLEGLVWTARMWKRAMNTASHSKFTRVK